MKEEIWGGGIGKSEENEEKLAKKMPTRRGPRREGRKRSRRRWPMAKEMAQRRKRANGRKLEGKGGDEVVEAGNDDMEDEL
jgi:hypothetical protein